MPAPFLKIALIAASISVAAFLALYEEWPQFRAFVDGNRERLAQAFEGSGYGVRPPSPRADDESATAAESSSSSNSEDEKQARANRRANMAQANEKRWRSKQRVDSFDDMVTEDGMLRAERAEVSGVEMRDLGLRKRRGRAAWNQGKAFADPFADEHEAFFDRDEDTASSATLEEKLVDLDPKPLVDVTPSPPRTLWQTASTGAFGTSSETVALDQDLQKAIEESLLHAAIEASRKQDVEDKALEAAIKASLVQSVPEPIDDAQQQHLLDTQDDLYGDPDASFYSMPAPEMESDALPQDPPIVLPSLAPGAAQLAQPVSPLIDEEEDYDIPTPGASTPLSADEFATDDAFSSAASEEGVSIISAADAAELQPSAAPRDYDAISHVEEISNADSFSEVGVSTPGDWSEVDSDVESVAGAQGHARS